jgi:uncharacterized protein involved in exopolysaccharide biosynthesis
MNSAHPTEAALDLSDIWRATRTGWRLVLAWIVIGLAIGAALELFWPHSFEGRASVLLRSSNDGGTSFLSRIGVPSEVTSGLLGTAVKSPMETELQLLESRSLLEEASDSIGLQLRVISPRGVPSAALIVPRGYSGSFKKQRYTFAPLSPPVAGQYRVTGNLVDTTVSRGATIKLPVATVTLRDSLPANFAIEILDHEDMLKREIKRLAVQKSGGEVAAIVFQEADSITSAAVPNLLVSLYLRDRRTVDKGTNQRRYEFLTIQADSLNRQLLAVQRDLRKQQEASHVLDPEISGKALLETDLKLREQLESAVVEQVALNDLLTQVSAGKIDARRLAAYPSFLKSPGINELLSQLGKLEAERAGMLQDRTPNEPTVAGRTAGIKALEAQLLPLATTYAASLARQRQELERMRDSLDGSLEALPGAAESWLTLTREVKRMTATELAVQAQRLEARLAAIGEGGDARQVDFAEPSKKPAFPTPAISYGVGGGAGLVFGVIAALMSAFMGRTIKSPDDAERAAGVASSWARDHSALLVSHDGTFKKVLVAPLGRDANAQAVARILTETESQRDHALEVAAVGSLDRVESAAQLGTGRAVLFAARAGTLNRRTLVEAVNALRRAGVPCAGVALHHDLSRT